MVIVDRVISPFLKFVIDGKEFSSNIALEYY